MLANLHSVQDVDGFGKFDSSNTNSSDWDVYVGFVWFSNLFAFSHPAMLPEHARILRVVCIGHFRLMRR